MNEDIFKLAGLFSLRDYFFDIFDFAPEPVLFEENLSTKLHYRVALDSPEVLNQVATEDLIEMDFFGKGFNGIWVREIIQGRVFPEGIATFEKA
jgi:hypothetical protein